MAIKPRRWQVPLPYCPIPLAYIETWMPVLPPPANMVMMALIRATWGRQKQTDVLAISVIAQKTGLPLRTVERSLSQLRKHGLIVCDGPQRHPKAITIIAARFLERPGTAIQAVRNVFTMQKSV
jgi:hypothetical protein